MSESKNWGDGTKWIKEGYRQGIGEARVLKIIQSTT